METNHSDEKLAPRAPSTPRVLSELDPDDARHSIATIKRSSSQSRKSLVSSRHFSYPIFLVFPLGLPKADWAL